MFRPQDWAGCAASFATTGLASAQRTLSRSRDILRSRDEEPISFGRNMVFLVIAATRLARQVEVMSAQTMMINSKRLIPMAGRLAFGAVILFGIVATNEGAVEATSTDDGDKARMLKPPAHGTIPAAFLMSEGAVMIDFAGPWEAFREAMVPGRQDHPFHLYT